MAGKHNPKCVFSIKMEARSEAKRERAQTGENREESSKRKRTGSKREREKQQKRERERERDGEQEKNEKQRRRRGRVYPQPGLNHLRHLPRRSLIACEYCQVWVQSGAGTVGMRVRRRLIMVVREKVSLCNLANLNLNSFTP